MRPLRMSILEQPTKKTAESKGGEAGYAAIPAKVFQAPGVPQLINTRWSRSLWSLFLLWGLADDYVNVGQSQRVIVRLAAAGCFGKCIIISLTVMD